MILETLRLADFRNFRSLEIGFEGRSAAIWGPNGRGKTNLLEAIFLLGATRSHRTRRDAELVRFESRAFSVAGELRKGGGGRTTLALVYEEGAGKRGSVDRKEVARLSEMVGRCGVVFVSPEDVDITRGEPERRRQFLDLTLCTLSGVYLRSLQEYQRVHRHRGRLLREGFGRGGGALLDPWDRQLARFATPLLEMRREALEELGPIAEGVYGELGGGERLEVAYVPGVRGDDGASEEAFVRKLRMHRERDLRTGRTSVGPHLDDVEILLGGKTIRSFGSRGQHRTAVLALKIAAGRLMRRVTKESPLLLLDDVFTELDEGRSLALAERLAGEGQVFATGTDRSDLERYFPDAVRFSLPEEGMVVREG
ncbi:MAG: DNA replication/repair protein RecF [Candidatus Eisenbacteria bacterium]